MAASNKQPAGNRPGPKGVNTHAPHKAGNPGGTHTAPAPKGPGDKKGHNPPPTGKNKNVLH